MNGPNLNRQVDLYQMETFSSTCPQLFIVLGIYNFGLHSNSIWRLIWVYILCYPEFYISFHYKTRDIHVECFKQFKLNLYFYVSGQSRPFWRVHSWFFLHIERSIWCFAVMVTIFERFWEYSKIVPLVVSQSSLLLSWLNFCKLSHTSTTEKNLKNTAVLLQ